jgi:hypothetical protein
MAQDFLLWCAAINYAILLLWFLLFTLTHDWWCQLNGKWFRFSIETFDALNYGGIAIYKLAIVLFNLVPFIALLIVG